jgi:predicted ArsR family transcriptional regulator
MSEDLKSKVLNLVKEGDVAVSYVAKRLGIQHMEALKILEELVSEGKISKKGKRYRIAK